MKSGRYIKYALGEIFLVVIGILIAVQINNWNQGIKSAKEGRFILERLKDNLYEDVATTLREIELAERNIDGIRQLIKEMEDQSLDTFSFDYTNSLISLTTMTLQTATWENLKTSGKTGLIGNQVLADSIYTYYNKFNNNTVELMDALRQYTREVVSPHLMGIDDVPFLNDGDLFTSYPVQSKRPAAYASDLKFRNICRLRLLLLTSLIDMYHELDDRAQRIIIMIDEEIKDS